MTHILAFEPDPTFAAELVEVFAAYGITVDVTDDGADGIAAGEANPPAMALITVELPSMQGYKVCKRFKKSERLAHVPVVMMSGDPAAEDTFANHRKLRMRADEYVLKPITAAALYEVISPLLADRPTTEPAASPAGPPPADFGDADEATVIHTINVDDEIDAFAENAFQNIIASDEASSETPLDAVAASDAPPLLDASPPLMAPPAPPESAPEGELSDSIEIETIQLDDLEMSELEAAVETDYPSYPAPDLSADVPMAPPPAELPAESSEALQAAQAQIASLQQELEAARSQPITPSSSSSREILDLREQLNAKDRQLLQLRDAAGPKDKEILDLRDRLLSVERTNAEAGDTIERVQRDLEESKLHNQTLTADNEGYAKRLDDFKGRMERSDSKATQLEENLEQARGTHRLELERQQADNDIAVAEMEQNHETALSNALTQARSEIEAASAAHADAFQQATTQHATATDELHQAHAQEITSNQEAHQAQLDAQTSESANALESARTEHQRATEELHASSAAAQEAALEHLRNDLDLQRQEETAKARESASRALQQADDDHAADMARREAELDDVKETALTEMRGQHAQELAVLSRKLTESESRAEELDASLNTTSANLEVARQSIDSLTSDRAAAQTALDDSRERESQLTREHDDVERGLNTATDKLARVAQAMAIGLAVIEEHAEATEEPTPSSPPSGAPEAPPQDDQPMA